jgi:TusA-related sulfurtransferase
MEAPAAVCDAGSLSFSDGLSILLLRKLDTLSPGQILELQSTDSSLEHDLRAWARLTANRWLSVRSSDRRHSHFIEKGTAKRVLTSTPTDWGNRATTHDGQLDSRALLLGAAARIPADANPATGFSPRGAVVEDGSPPFPFDVLNAGTAWGPESAAFYDQAGAGHWNAATDIRWDLLRELESELERSVCQLMTFLAENEFSALYIPAKWIARIHPHFLETILFLSTQVRDEARHIEVFIKRALANGGGLQFSSVSTQQSLKTLFDREDFLEASFLLSVLGEGTFLDLLRFIESHAPDPVTSEIACRTRIDEARHVHFALSHIRHAISSDPSSKRKLSRAALDRAAVLADVRTLNPLVEESLIILAAGGLNPQRLPAGTRALQELYSSMHENRIKRLQLVGFSKSEAAKLSESHTPNFM